MTLELSTIEGKDIEAGIWGCDITKVQLGELPPITTPQFAGYASMTLVQDVIPGYDHLTRLEWATKTRVARGNLDITPQIEITGKFFAQDVNTLAAKLYKAGEEDLDELIIEIQSTASPLEEPEYYAENPFGITTEGNVSMANDRIKHIITADSFHNIVHHVLVGGVNGWYDTGVYDEVRDAAKRIDDALSL